MLAAFANALVRSAGVALRAYIIALTFFGIGCVIGLPVGAVLRRTAPEVSDSSDKSGRIKPAGATGKKPAAAATNAENPLAAQLRAILENERSLGAGGEMTGFDGRAAELLRGLGTEALRADAIELAQSKKSDTPEEVLRTIFMEWARREPGAAWDAALKAIPNSRSSALAANALAGCLLATSATDYLAALKRLDGIADESVRGVTKEKLERNATRFVQPEPLARRLAAMPESERPKGLLKDTMMTWGQRHLHAALDFTKSLPQEDREQLMPMFCQVLAVVDEAEAERQAASIQDPKHSAAAWSGIFSIYNEFNPDLAIDLLQRLPVEQMDASFFADIRSGFHLPAEVVAGIAARLTGKSRENFLSSAFQGSYLINDKALQTMLNAIELQPEDGKCINAVVGRLIRTSPDTALAWADSLPESPLRDHVMAEASERVRETDREKSLTMSGSIQDDTLRLKALRSNIESWLQNDRVAAVAWLKSARSNVMPPEERDRWLHLSGVR